MEDIVKELKKIVPFKDSTTVGDIVLIAIENPKSVVYAIVLDIVRDEAKRDEWWHLTLNILSVPPQQTTWTLRESQFTGQEIFTMGGEGRFIKAVDLALKPASELKLGVVEHEKTSKSAKKNSPVSQDYKDKKVKKSKKVKSNKTTLRVVK